MEEDNNFFFQKTKEKHLINKQALGDEKKYE